MSDDLVPLFGDPPEQPSQDVRFRQGVILAFNQVTLQNTVLVGGTPLSDLPLLGVGEATLLVPGAVVGLLLVGGPAKTMFILGRAVNPNTADATSAVSLLNSQIFSDFILTGESTTSTTYTDLATVGPRVTVPVGPSGRILVIASAQIQNFSFTGSASLFGGYYDLEFTGANTRSPVTVNDPLVGVKYFQLTTVGNNTWFGRDSTTAQAIFSGLNAGTTTITMKYAMQPGASADADFHRRALTVIKL